jgi:hypothetical protein
MAFVLNTGTTLASLHSVHLPVATVGFNTSLDVLDILRPVVKYLTSSSVLIKSQMN